MATRLAWLLNLDADLELQDPVAYRDQAMPLERALSLRPRMQDLVADHDVILGAPPHHVTGHRSPLQASGAGDSHPRNPWGEVALAFCPTPSALAQIKAHGFTPPDAPSFEVIRRVNDRRFNAQVGQTLPGAAFVDDMQTLERHLAAPSPSGNHVIKRAFSFAGREQRRVRDGVLDPSTRGFCERSFRDGEGVQVEPWVDRLLDCSMHGYVLRDGRLLCGEARVQQIDAMGRFLGMVIDVATMSDTERSALTTEITRVGTALRDAGYFGPFGIDAFRYRHTDGTLGFNPRCEINARFTMGYPRALLLDALSL